MRAGRPAVDTQALHFQREFAPFLGPPGIVDTATRLPPVSTMPGPVALWGRAQSLTRSKRMSRLAGVAADAASEKERALPGWRLLQDLPDADLTLLPVKVKGDVESRHHEATRVPGRARWLLSTPS